ncbi:hypothetical protein DFJ74DRAFT_11663 [Hyaloraphidium curvatum]|nr:hypothetical protein DFJ74DRAFT_11663 [Hyaloraphidium curvatum]
MAQQDLDPALLGRVLKDAVSNDHVEFLTGAFTHRWPYRDIVPADLIPCAVENRSWRCLVVLGAAAGADPDHSALVRGSIRASLNSFIERITGAKVEYVRAFCDAVLPLFHPRQISYSDKVEVILSLTDPLLEDVVREPLLSSPILGLRNILRSPSARGEILQEAIKRWDAQARPELRASLEAMRDSGPPEPASL